MDGIVGAELTECIARLNSEERRAVMRHWDRVTAEEWVPPSERVSRLPSLAEMDERRRRRGVRRQLASVTRIETARRSENPHTASADGPDAA